MAGDYVGVLSAEDPLYALLTRDVLGRELGVSLAAPVFDAYRLHPSATAYRYEERRSGLALVGKFFGNKWIDGAQTGGRERRAALMRREFANLRRARALGLDAPPYQVVRPLAADEAINCVLVEAFAPGPDLGEAVRAAALHGQADMLHDRVGAVAGFLARLHLRSRANAPVGPAEPLEYMGKLIAQLEDWQVIGAEQRRRLARLRERWAASGRLAAAQRSLLHGDATPAHFLFDGGGVTAIDLERMREGDPAADLGCVAAELKHLMFWHRGDAWAAEPFIQQFYAAYAAALELPRADFAALTERCRFFMGCYELRIGRNSWLDLGYRRRLVEEAEACLAI
jgi:aminoglycoside phosphotransferase (APT) family kinase protein